MAEYHESFDEDVGSKLLLLATFLLVFGVLALVLMPLGAAFAPPPPPPAEGAAAVPAPSFFDAFVPGIGLLVGSLVIGTIAGLLLGHAKARRDEPTETTH